MLEILNDKIIKKINLKKKQKKLQSTELTYQIHEMSHKTTITKKKTRSDLKLNTQQIKCWLMKLKIKNIDFKKLKIKN